MIIKGIKLLSRLVKKHYIIVILKMIKKYINKGFYLAETYDVDEEL